MRTVTTNVSDALADGACAANLTSCEVELRNFGCQRGKGGSLTGAPVRKLTGLSQMDIYVAVEQLEAEGMITIERTYTLLED